MRLDLGLTAGADSCCKIFIIIIITIEVVFGCKNVTPLLFSSESRAVIFSQEHVNLRDCVHVGLNNTFK